MVFLISKKIKNRFKKFNTNFIESVATLVRNGNFKIKKKKIKYKRTFYKNSSRKFSNQIPFRLNSKKEYNFRIRQVFSLGYSFYKDGFMSSPSWPKHLNAFTSYFLFKHF